MNTGQIRNLFLNYFKQQNHTIVPSSSLVPIDDPSLLFTNAGMVQFKKVFLGQETLPYKRAASCQRCLRVGGKHNDLENVGFTSRHHTFFEMLGNFSFGDYFKKEAICYAWEFITKYLKIPASKLWITVYEKDFEAEEIWLNTIKIDPTRLSRCDANENFWSMGDVGPCGPCTEIYYDHGPEFPGVAPGLGDPQERYIEIYNLVFMQYDRTASGELRPLPKPCVDTGMGLERVAAIMQGVHNNYDIDIFVKLIKDLSKLLHIDHLEHNSLRVIADHLRACSFLILDGIFPSNEGKGYVLRRIIRRAIRHGYKLGKREPFLHLAVESLSKIMGNDFTALKDMQHKISQVLLNEELQFSKTLANGIKLLSETIDTSKNMHTRLISGEIIFKLYDTYGFPIDLTMDILREHNMEIDLANFERCMLAQKTRGRSLMKFKDLAMENLDLNATEFVGYEQNLFTTTIKQIFSNDNKPLDFINCGEEAKIILAATPFYAEAGGQVGDQGLLTNQGNIFTVTDTQKTGNTNIHIGKVKSGILKLGDPVQASINTIRRKKIQANHSATHLLHAALRAILGSHVKQKGSLVDDNRLRFDFEHFQPLTKQQILSIELTVNAKIRDNQLTITEVMPIEEALNKGAIALFDDKYTEQVRVLNIGDSFSIELCGGTHAVRTGDLGGFKIINENAVSAGIRRIEAITGEALVNYNHANQEIIDNLMKICKISIPDLIEPHLNKLMQKTKYLEKELDHSYKKIILLEIENLKSKIEVVGSYSILVSTVDFQAKYLKFAIDILKSSLNKALIILGCKDQNKAIISVGITKNLNPENTDTNKNQPRISAIDLVNEMATIIDGKGGGRIDLAEASGGKANNLSIALNAGYHKIIKILTK